ncbi:MAG TPA: hypothetical protein V6C97_08990 [Oculatellaceae cyanobacterium]
MRRISLDRLWLFLALTIVCSAGRLEFLSAAHAAKSTATKTPTSVEKPTKEHGSTPGWKVVQQSTYAGEQTCYITSLGTKIQSKLVTSVIRLPAKSVLLYNDDTRGYCQLSYEQWMSQMRRKVKGNSRKIIRGESGTVCGIKAIQYKFENVIGSKRRVTEEYWTAASSEIPTQLTSPLSDLADLPNDLGLPLKIIQYKADGSKNVMLDTISFKKVKVDNAIYNKPVGYENMHDPITLVLGAQ